jgi:hypothetical protein
MIDYLYYKLYQATLKGSLRDIPQFIAPVYFAGLISINILVVYVFFVKIDILPYIFRNAKQAGWLVGLLIVLSLLYFGKVKREAILQKYSNEDREKRIRGNIIVAIYVALSFLLIYVIALFRPGKL